MSTTPYCYGSEGNSHFLRAAADAIDGTLSVYFADAGAWVQDSNLPRTIPALVRNENPRAFGFTEVAGTFVLYIATCFGKKIFDEFYDRLLKRPLKPFLDRLCSSEELPSGKPIELQDVVYLSDIDLVVVIRTVVAPESTAEITQLFLHAHRAAHAYIEANGRKAPVHSHIIENGRVSLEPELFLSLEHQAATKGKAHGKSRTEA